MADETKSKVGVSTQNRKRADLNSKLCDALDECGLEKEYWLEIFSTQFAITKSTQLKHLNKNNIDELKKFIKQPWEVNALDELFNCIKQTLDNSSVQKTEEQFKALDDSLKNVDSKNENRSMYKRVQTEIDKNENTDFSQGSNSNLDTLLVGLKSTSNLSSSQTPNLEGVNILENASAGQLVRGVYIFRASSLERKSSAVEIVSNVNLKSPAFGQYEFVQRFSSKTKKSSFDKCFEVTNKALDGHFQLFGRFGLNFIASGEKENESTDVQQENTNHVYESIIKYSFVPVKSVELRVEDFRCKKEVLETLKMIEVKLDQNQCTIELLKDCTEFFVRFGTHVNVGVIHFGGIYKYNATCYYEDTTRKTRKKNIASDALEGGVKLVGSGLGATLGLCISGKTLKSNGLLKEEYSDEELSNVTVEISTNGGPPAASDDINAWKSGLVSDPLVWAVISGDQFTGIWNVLNNHSTDFVNVKRLIAVLESSWILGNLDLSLNDNTSYDQTFLTLQDTMTTLARNVRESNPIPKLIESDKHVQRFLNSIPDQYHDACVEKSSGIFWSSVKEAQFVKESVLMAITKRCIESHNTTDEILPPNYISSALYESTTERIIDKLHNKLLPQIRAQFTISKEKVEQHITSVMATLWRNHLECLKSKDSWDYLRATILLTKLQFDETEGFTRCLTVKEITEFVESSKNLLAEINKTISETSSEKNKMVIVIVNNLQTLEKRYSMPVFKRLMEVIGPEIDIEVKRVVENFIQESNRSWESLLANLDVALKSRDAKISMPVQQIYDIMNKVSSAMKDSISKPSLTKIAVLLEDFGLAQFLPNKLDLAHVINIRANTQKPKENAVWSLIEFIITEDSSVYESFEALLFAHGNENEIGYEDDFDFFNDGPAQNLQPIAINPLDVVVAVFACSSMQLKEIIVCKMQQIGLAIPVLLPFDDEEDLRFDMDIMRSILVSENPLQSAVDCPCTVLSFLRIGRPEFSKSKMVNEFIQKDSHDIFVNFYTPTGRNPRLFSDGTIEISVFTAAFDQLKKTEKTYCAVNLRGDACNHPVQRNFMSKISNVVFIFVPISQLTDEKTIEIIKKYIQAKLDFVIALETASSTKDEIINILTICKTSLQINAKYVRLMDGNKPRPFMDICRDMRRKIPDKLERPEVTLSRLIEDLGIGTLRSEETTKAEDTCKILCTSNICRSEIVPMQMELLRELCSLEKSFYNPKEHKTLVGREEIRVKIQALRRKQLKRFLPMHDFLVSCIGHFLGYINNGSKLVAFANGLKKTLQLIENGPFERFDKSSDIEMAEPCLSFEHILRELGQLYDVVAIQQSLVDARTNDLTKMLPSVAAKLLCHGFPFEIINGEMIHVNTKWIQAVIEELIKLKGNKKCLIVSVVGTQSSGKSTLLNAMYGLRFPVGHGRVTKGAFVQLIPVDNKSLPFEYILVIDTEGLRAPELSSESFKRDNGLATFVMGLADVTIVNIQGEHSAEMNEILEMVVYSLLRIRLVNNEMQKIKSCIFTHRGVAIDQSSRELEETMQSIMRNLDKKTMQVAQLLQNGEVKTFNDVIRFDPKKQVFYLPELMTGEGPVKYINKRYSAKVKEIKQHILSEFTGSSHLDMAVGILTLENFSLFIKDVWNSVIGDDFALLFKSSMELTAFTLFDKKIHEITWEIERDMNSFIHEKRCILVKCSDDDALEKEVTGILSSLPTVLEEHSNKAKWQIDTFIDSHELKNVMEKYRQTSRLRTDEAIRCERKRSETKLLEIKDGVKGKRQCNTLIQKCKEHINNEAANLAKEYKMENINIEKLSEAFKTQWTNWITRFLPITANNNDNDLNFDQIYAQIQQRMECASDIAFEPRDFKERHITHIRGSIKLNDIEHTIGGNSKHISIKKKCVGYIPTILPKECKEQVLHAVNNLLGEIENYFTERESEDGLLNIADVINPLKKIDVYMKMQNEKEGNFKLTNKFKELILSKAIPFCIHKYIEINKRYYNTHCPLSLLRKYKPTAKQLFIDLVKNKASDKLAADLFIEAVSECLEDDVMELLPKDVEDIVLKKFKHSKYELLKDVMKYLAEIDRLDLYMVYLNEPKYFVHSRLIGITNELLFKKADTRDSGLFSKLFTNKVKTLLSGIKEAVFASSIELKDKPGNLADRWVCSFVQNANRSSISEERLSHVKKGSITHIDDFKQAVLLGLDQCVEKLIKQAEKTTIETLRWRESPYPDIFDKLWGCQECCPFCNEPCELTKGHTNSVRHMCRHHRPLGVRDFAWTRGKGKLVSDVCSNLVTTEETFEMQDSTTQFKFRHYKQRFPEWEIHESFVYPKYWIWFFRKYNEEIANLNQVPRSSIPPHWPKVNKIEALDSL